jgi:Uma2 family endonuclease
MATANETSTQEPSTKKQRPWGRRDGLFRFTVEQFFKLDELGFFDGRKVELIRGFIYEMTINTPHATTTRLANEVLRGLFGRGWVVSDGLPLDTGRRSLLQPDFTVVVGSARDYRHVHPRTAALVLEISDSTLRKDRIIKAHLYAQAGLTDYWIINLVDRQLEVHRNPGPDPSRRGRFRFADVTIVAESGRMAPLAAPESEIAVADLLP